MLIDDTNLYDIKFPEDIELVGVCTNCMPIYNMESSFFTKVISFGAGGDYEVYLDMYWGLLVLKPLFFYKRDGDGVESKHLALVQSYGGRIIYDIMEI